MPASAKKLKAQKEENLITLRQYENENLDWNREETRMEAYNQTIQSSYSRIEQATESCAKSYTALRQEHTSPYGSHKIDKQQALQKKETSNRTPKIDICEKTVPEAYFKVSPKTVKRRFGTKPDIKTNLLKRIQKRLEQMPPTFGRVKQHTCFGPNSTKFRNTRDKTWPADSAESLSELSVKITQRIPTI